MLELLGPQNHKDLNRFSDTAIKTLRQYSWPGNTGGLRNVIERAAILRTTDTVRIERLTAFTAPHTTPLQLGDRVSPKTIEGNHTHRVVAPAKTLQEAAGILGIGQATLWHKRKQYGI